MGGYGSGWHRPKKTVVEDCLYLCINTLARQAYLDGCDHFTSWSWRRREQFLGFVYLSFQQVDATLTWLTITHPGGESYLVSLLPTVPHFGGFRWWFACPRCGRRAGKLFMPLYARRFACRCCHNLTYRSAQEHDKRADFLCRNPKALLAEMQNREDLTRLPMYAFRAHLKWPRKLEASKNCITIDDRLRT